ncbi:hypothetical protein OXPF_37280 [Oxobacter pfennigii]|uniref:DUF370 domain-containing protein n=1 Tax=Oxobacter pfennigii TaxID=36849 RepID=A0A0P8Y8D6_9CLOT|nr:extracellular matrix/biofilm biosynthesis regulator RemA family protein [Oxobacter pfennigii]KPU42959.1 hypothetical protein OXPF_37280 [Oxobacter pfennigii]
MFIHLGENVVIPIKGIISIMDMESTNMSNDTKQFLKTAEEEGFVRKISQEKPKSFILAEINKKSIIYLSPISSVTLSKRSGFIDTL